jgi:uncharacterized Zn-binding protein involved in type VI secretion
MGNKLSRKGDTNQTGGAIVRGAGTVYCNFKPVGLHVSPITPHAPWPRKRHPPHKSAVTTSASPDVYCEGSPVLRVTSGNSCGHSIVQGSDDVDVS